MLSRLMKPGFAAIALLSLTLFAAACSDDDDDANAQETGASDAELHARVDRLEVEAVMASMRNEGLHEIDDEAQAASEIGDDWAGRVERMYLTTAGTTWPEAFQEQGEALESDLEALNDALEAEDLGSVKEASANAHQTWHDLEHDAYAFIGGQEPGAHGEEESSGAEESPHG
jgi:hypothetical protein